MDKWRGSLDATAKLESGGAAIEPADCGVLSLFGFNGSPAHFSKRNLLVKRTVYTRESPLRHPGRLLSELIGDLFRSRELIGILFFRDLKAAYRQSYLGYFWVLLPPLLSTALWYFLVSQQIFKVGDTSIPYPAYVLTGQVFWSTFVGAFNMPMSSFNASAAIFTKLKVTPEAFIAAGMGKTVFEMTLRLLLLVPLFFLFDLSVPSTVVLVPVALIAILLMGLSLGLLLVPFNSLYHDVGRLTGMLLQVLMYTTPVIYPPPTSGLAAKIVQWNPLTPLIVGSRDWLTTGPSEFGFGLFALIPISLFLILVASLFLRTAMPHLIVRMGM